MVLFPKRKHKSAQSLNEFTVYDIHCEISDRTIPKHQFHVVFKTCTIVEPVLKDHPSSRKNMVSQRQVVFGNRFNCIKMWGLLP